MHTYKSSLVATLLIACGTPSEDLKLPNIVIAADQDFDGDGFTEGGEEVTRNYCWDSDFGDTAEDIGCTEDSDCTDHTDTGQPWCTSTILSTNKDCDDFNADIHPDAIEICDDIDNDCDGKIDDADDWTEEDGVQPETRYYPDTDGDGYGNANSDGIPRCAPLPGYVSNAGDCDDENYFRSPDAIEVCDGIDNDCDGLMDDADDSVDLSTSITFYQDLDGDGYGTNDGTVTACSQPAGYSPSPTDCDDGNPDLNPGQAEVCDGDIDNDCDGLADEEDDNLQPSNNQGGVFYRDYDGDGEGDPDYPKSDCENPTGYVSNSTDCNDYDAAINNSDADQDGLTSCPGTDGMADCNDEDAAIGAVDDDNDGYLLCLDDCDDSNANVSPDDNDGDGISACEGDCDDTDPAVGINDSDGDGYSSCYVDCNDDADSDGANIYPGAATGEPHLCTRDYDGDGFGDQFVNCLFIYMYDEYVDGWDGGSLNVFIDGIEQTGDGFPVTLGEDEGTGVEKHFCTEGAASVELTATPGDFPEEISFVIKDSQETILLEEYNFTTYSEGESVFSRRMAESGTDCKDIDYNIGPLDLDYDGLSTCQNDCNDFTKNIGLLDVDGDGFYPTECYGTDCDDYNAAINTNAEEIWYDGVDQDCDGHSDFDQDFDGDILFGYDFDEDGTLDTFWDLDGDGLVDFQGGSDCDDEDPEYNSNDRDQDGFTSCGSLDGCDDFGGDTGMDEETCGALADCVDKDANTYPGAAALTHPTECLTDADGDGYAEDTGGRYLCFDVAMSDSYGDGWNGAYVEVFEDGFLLDTLQLQNPGLPYTPNQEEYENFCIEEGYDLELVFFGGSYDFEIGLTLTEEDSGIVYFTQTNFNSYNDGDTIYSVSIPTTVLVDCDDEDPNLYPGNGCN
ncbi:MAG: MopE-related protein [Myxococcota bacterium]